DAPPLKGHERMQAVVQLGSPVVVDDGAHGILDVDLGAEDATVPAVAVDGLRLQVQAFPLFALPQVDMKLACRRVLAVQAALAPLGTGRSVKVSRSRGVHSHGLLLQPPVDQVKMVSRLVDKKAAGVFFSPVPAAVVVGAV